MDKTKLAKEVKELRKENEELRERLEKYRTDNLTDLPRRGCFQEIGEKLIKHSQRKKNPFCLVYFDLDNLKEINDQKGHEAGNKILKDFAKIIDNNSRPFDFVFRENKKPETAFRLGGDEFVLFCNSMKKKEAKKLIKRIKNITDIEFSAGIAEFNPSSNIDLKELKKEADEEMYKKKRKKSSH